jgi:phosphatidylglycerol:prolipoprotein diacylglycerol transferase
MNLSYILTFIIWDIDPDIFTIPGLDHPIRWYGLSWALGLIASQQIMVFIYKREGRSPKEIDIMSIYIIAGTMIGARLGHVLFYDLTHYFQNPLSILAVWEGGLASHGGAVGILIGAYLFARKTEVNYLWVLDRLVIVGALTSCLIRIGNLMNSEMLGVPTNLPWGFVFTNVDTIPRHPAQLYEAIYLFFLFLFSLRIWLRSGSRMKNGFLLGWFLILLFSLRFITEYFKINQVPFEDGLAFNMGQLLSIPFVLTGVIILLTIRKQEVVINEEVIPLEKNKTKAG